MDYQDDPSAVHELLDELEEGDRVHVEAEAAESDQHEGFARAGRTLIDDTGTITESHDRGVNVELDEQIVTESGNDDYGAREFEIRGEPVIALWEPVGKIGEEEGWEMEDGDDVEPDEEDGQDDATDHEFSIPDQHVAPANLQVAMLNSISRVDR